MAVRIVVVMIISLFIAGMAWMVGIPVYNSITSVGTDITTGTTVSGNWLTTKGIMDYVVILAGFLCFSGILIWAFVRGQSRERQSYQQP